MTQNKSLSVLVFTICMTLIFGMFCSTDAKADIHVSVNGVPIEFDVQPVSENGKTCVPVRMVAEALEYNVSWDSEKNYANIYRDNEKIEIHIGGNTYVKNGEAYNVDGPFTVTDGRTMVDISLVESMFNCNVLVDESANTIKIIYHRVVNVSSVDEFYAEVGSYKRIIFSGGEYNLSNINKEISNSHIASEEVFDGVEYLIFEVDNLIIESEKGQKVTLLAEPRYANVLSFSNCSGVSIKNITAGHTIEPGNCIGGVIKFSNTKNASVDSCSLYGCGTYGISAEYSQNIDVKNTEIYECTYGLVEFSNCQNVTFDNCIFRDSMEFAMFSFYECENVAVNKSVIKNNVSDLYSSFIDSHESKDIFFKECVFENNTYSKFMSENVNLDNCQYK